LLAAVLGAFGKHGSEIASADSEAGLYERIAHAGQQGLGANLDAPADRDTADYPARPEWYFLFLFQLLKYFEGDQVLIGTVIIPNAIVVVLCLLPLFGFGRMRPFGYWLGVIVMVVLLAGAAVLTALAFASDSPEWAPKAAGYLGGSDADQQKAKEEAEGFQTKVEHAHVLATRAATLAMSGVPDDGARQLLRNDPLTKGHALFETNCASCHSFTTQPGDPFKGFTKGDFKASDLGNYGTSAWIRGLLENPSGPHYFGRTDLNGMKGWKAKLLKKRARLKKDDPKEAAAAIATQEKELDTIAKWVADQAKSADKRDTKLAETARPLFEDHCASCHKIGKDGGETAPDLTNYGSQAWIRGMLMAPGYKTRYGDKNKMPAFRNLEGPGSEIALQEFFDSNPDFPKDRILQLSDVERELIIRFLTRDDRVVFGGAAISGVRKESTKSEERSTKEDKSTKSEERSTK
jgi:ubiquinol-cytochrome c reductase cytochrome b subunit